MSSSIKDPDSDLPISRQNSREQRLSRQRSDAVLEKQASKDPRAKAPILRGKQSSRRSAIDDKTIHQINKTLSELPKKTQLNWKKISELAHLPNGNVFYNLKSGRSKLLSLETYIQLSIALGITVDELLGLEVRSVAQEIEPTLVVRSRAQMGLIQSTPDLPLNMQYQLSLPVAPTFRVEGAYGVECHDSNKETDFDQRLVLVVIPFRPSRFNLHIGQSVIIHSRTSGGVEVNVAQTVMTANGLAVRLQEAVSGTANNETYLIKPDGRFELAKARALTLEAIVVAKWQSALT